MPSPHNSVELRPGTDADVPAVIDLMKAALGEGRIPRTAEFWHWKHRQNPFGPSPMWVATAGAGDVVGVRLFLRWRWHHGTQSLSAVRAVDTATHPRFQGQGIFRRLTLALVEELTNEGVGFVFNTPNDQSRPGYLKMGWRNVGRISLWVQLRRPMVLLKGLRRPAGPSTGLEPELPEADTTLRSTFDLAQSSGLLQALRSPVQYHTRVDRDYLDWRYGHCPAVRYSALSTDPARALVVYRRRRRGSLQELTLCELLFEPSLAGAKALNRSIRAAVRATSPDVVVTAFRKDGPELMSLAALGFVPAPRMGPIFTVRELAGWAGAPDPRRLRSFRASIGDLELF